MTSLGPWSMPEEAFRFVEARPLTCAVELGSGLGTRRLVDAIGEVYSVEHDDYWLGVVKKAHYIHAPIVDGWYDPEAIRAGLPESYDCLIVDGPPGNPHGRLGMLKHLGLFKRVPVLVDDVQRPDEQRLLMALVEEWGADSFSVHHVKGGRAFATFGWGCP